MQPDHTEGSILLYFSQEAEQGRGNSVNGTIYVELNERDRQHFPTLSEHYGIALLEPSARDGQAAYSLFLFESEFDDAVLAGLSGMSSCRDIQ